MIDVLTVWGLVICGQCNQANSVSSPPNRFLYGEPTPCMTVTASC